MMPLLQLKRHMRAISGSEPRTAARVRQNGGQSERSMRGSARSIRRGRNRRSRRDGTARSRNAPRCFTRDAEDRSFPRAFGPLHSRL